MVSECHKSWLIALVGSYQRSQLLALVGSYQRSWLLALVGSYQRSQLRSGHTKDHSPGRVIPKITVQVGS
jgi:hypothetical protein